MRIYIHTYPMNLTIIAGRNFQNHCPKFANSIAISGSQGTSTYPRWIGTICAPPPGCKHPSFHRQITEVLNDSNLTQTVSLPTRDSNILDIFFTTNPTLVQRVSILPGISDHEIVQIQVKTSAKNLFQKPRSISLYKRANWDVMKQTLEAYHQDMLESGKYSSLNAIQLWDDLHSTLTSLTSKFVPSKLSSTRNNLPNGSTKNSNGLPGKETELFRNIGNQVNLLIEKSF